MNSTAEFPNTLTHWEIPAAHRELSATCVGIHATCGDISTRRVEVSAAHGCELRRYGGRRGLAAGVVQLWQWVLALIQLPLSHVEGEGSRGSPLWLPKPPPALPVNGRVFSARQEPRPPENLIPSPYRLPAARAGGRALRHTPALGSRECAHHSGRPAAAARAKD